MDKFLPTYFIYENKKHLRCCDKEYYNKELKTDDNVTCKKCFITYTLSDKKEINLCTNCNKLEKGQYFLKSYKIFTEPSKENIGYNTRYWQHMKLLLS
jgi:hypothetical protein